MIPNYAFIIIIFGLIAPQVVLSRREKSWPGLIIPVVCFVFSLYSTFGSHFAPEATASFIASFWLQALLVTNTTTLLYLAIYAMCHKRKHVL